MESNLGYLEFEMCSLLGVTPKQLGEFREKDPIGIIFLENHYIYRKVEEHKAIEKSNKTSQRKSGGKIIRRA